MNAPAVLASHGLFLDLVFNVVCAILLIYFAEPLFHLLGARGEILDLVVAYITIWALGIPPSSAWRWWGRASCGPSAIRRFPAMSWRLDQGCRS